MDPKINTINTINNIFKTNFDTNNLSKAIEEINQFLKSDNADYQISKWLYVDYLNNPQIYHVNHQYIELKINQICEMILGSKQKNINQKEIITKLLGIKYPIYEGKGKTYLNIFPWEVVENNSFKNIWKINTDTYNKEHMKKIFILKDKCSFKKEEDLNDVLDQFINMMDPNYNRNQWFK